MKTTTPERRSFVEDADGNFKKAYKQSIIWTEFNGHTAKAESDWCHSLEYARQQALEIALRNGWTPPKWWQWWRWNDTRITKWNEP